MIILNSDYLKLADIAYEQIEGKFWYGRYGQFRVVMMKDCGFINATKLCRDGGKDLRDWNANKNSKDLLQCLATKLGDDGDSESIFVRKIIRTAQQTDVEKAVSGTYYNPLIIPHIACWISPDFAILVSDIVNYFLVGEYKKCLEEEQARRRSADVRATEEQSRHLNAEQWAKEEKAGREVATQLLQLMEEQNEVMKRELAYVVKLAYKATGLRACTRKTLAENLLICYIPI